MTKPAKATAGGAGELQAPPDKPESLEQAMETLEAILAEMESGDLPLEELIGRFEKGVGLVKFCRQRLESAEKRIEIVTNQLDGSLSLEEFRTEAQ